MIHIYVLDRGNDRIVKVDTEGNVLGALYSFFLMGHG